MTAMGMERIFTDLKTKINTMNRYELIDKVVAEIAKDKGISEGEVGTYDTLLRVADIAVKNCSIPDSEQSLPDAEQCLKIQEQVKQYCYTDQDDDPVISSGGIRTIISRWKQMIG